MAGSFVFCGTVKKVVYKKSARLVELHIVPTSDYAVKGVLDPRVTLALFRPECGAEDAKLLDYDENIVVSGIPDAKVGAVKYCLIGRTVCFELDTGTSAPQLSFKMDKTLSGSHQFHLKSISFS